MSSVFYEVRQDIKYRHNAILNILWSEDGFANFEARQTGVDEM